LHVHLFLKMYVGSRQLNPHDKMIRK